MKNKEKVLLSLSLVILIFALGPLTAGAASSNTWTVHPTDQKANFTKIQDAVNNAIDGDYIEVWNSTYTENIYVNKSLTIYSRDGKAVTIVQASNPNDYVFEVTADLVNISGFTLRNATESEIAGIYLSGVEQCNISYNSVTNNDIGIALIGSSNNIIRDNLAELNIFGGICLLSSNDNMVTNNTGSFTESGYGIILYNSSDNKITNNIVNSNFASGISLTDSSNNNITNNTASYNGAAGIELYSTDRSTNNLIDNNTASSNGGSGIIFLDPYFDDNIITNNMASYNGYGGIELYGGNYYVITNNTANSNGGSGIALWDSTNHNIVENNTVSYNEYSGIELIYNTTSNIIKNNTASHNNVSGIALYHSSSDNTVSHNELSSNQFGLSIVSLGRTPSNNQLMDNSISYSKSHGIYLLDLKYANNVTNNTVSNSNLYGILVENSSNNNISANTANQNQRGIGLVDSSAIGVMDNVANSNEISGITLINSSNNTLHNNTARNNTYEGIYLLNSSSNNLSENKVSSSYFWISLYSSNNNTITENVGESIYYYKVFKYSSTGNTIINFAQEDIHNQTDIIRAVKLYVLQSRTPSLQSVDNATNATYDIVVENLGNMPDTFDLNISSSNDQYAVSLDKNTVSLGPGAISTNTTTYEILPDRVKINVETIKLDVSGNEPGVCRVNVKATANSTVYGRDETVKDVIETWTIVRSSQINETAWEDNSIVINATIIDSALIDSEIHDSTIIQSAIINDSYVSGSTITASVIKNSEVIWTSLPSDVILEDAIVNNGNISSGNITIYGSPGITFVIRKETPISELIVGSDCRDSNLVGLTYVKSDKSLTVDCDNSDTSFDIYAEYDYFAGSLSVQRSIIPPFGFMECDNNVGGYEFVEVSDNVAQSTDLVVIKVKYDPALPPEVKNSLTLMYYNENAKKWEPLPDSGNNLEENYVWGNISHYSVFSVSGSVTQKGVPPPMPGGGRAPLDNDDDGLTNIQELIIGTDPDNPDTDGDGLKDGEDPFPLDPDLPVRLTPTPTPVLPPGVNTIPTDPTGLVTSSVTAYSADGKASVTIPAGTIAKDAAGNPLIEVTVTLPSALPAEVPSELEYVGIAIQLGPEGATFSQPVEISITFDSAQFEGKKPVIYVYEAGAWKPLETTIVGNKATATVDHFSIFVLFAEQAAPTPTSTPPSLAFPIAAPFLAVPMVVVLAIVVIIAAVAYVALRRRR